MNFSTRRLRRLLVRIRVSRLTVPLLLLFLWCGIVAGLASVADSWIVLLASSPLFFALFLAMLCFWAYRRDFYA